MVPISLEFFPNPLLLRLPAYLCGRHGGLHRLRLHAAAHHGHTALLRGRPVTRWLRLVRARPVPSSSSPAPCPSICPPLCSGGLFQPPSFQSYFTTKAQSSARGAGGPFGPRHSLGLLEDSVCLWGACLCFFDSSRLNCLEKSVITRMSTLCRLNRFILGQKEPFLSFHSI